MRVTGVFFVALLSLSDASAANDIDFDICRNEIGELSLAACSRVIDDPAETPVRRAEAFQNRGLEYSAEGDAEKALADLNQALELNPTSAMVYNGRGLVYYDAGDYDLAIADFSQAMTIDPDFAWPYHNRALAYGEKGDPTRAIADYTDAIRLDPDFSDTFNNRGYEYEGLGDFASALADYEAAIRVDPTSSNPYDGIATVRFKTGDYAGAADAAGDAIRLDPEVDQFYRDRGVANFYAGALEAAQADLSRAVELAPQDAYNALWLEVVAERSGGESRLVEASVTIDMSAWPAPIVQLFLGQLAPAALLAEELPARVCEASFFAAQFALRRGASDEAMRLFQGAARDCPVDNDARYAATAELKAAGALQ